MGTRIVTAETRQWGRLLDQARNAGYARATADIVAWLRNEAATGPFYAAPLNDTANAIERGDFRKVTA